MVANFERGNYSMLVIHQGMVYIPQYFTHSNNTMSLNMPICLKHGNDYIISDESSTAYAYTQNAQKDTGSFYTGFLLKDNGRGCLTVLDRGSNGWDQTTTDGFFAVIGSPAEIDIYRGLWIDNLCDIRKTIADISQITEQFSKFVKWHIMILPSYGGKTTDFKIGHVWYGNNGREHKLINKMNRGL